MTFDYNDVGIDKMITHIVGNSERAEALIFSEGLTEYSDVAEEYLIKYLLQKFNPEDLYSFNPEKDFSDNKVFFMAKSIFEDPSQLVHFSKELGNLLYANSNHPKIKESKFHVALFNNLVLGDEVVTGLGLFKSQLEAPFLKMNQDGGRMKITSELGHSINGLDKGVLILNIEAEYGYKALLLDTKNPAMDTQYWKDHFLKLHAINNEFHQTTEFMKITKDFISDNMSDEFGINRADQIDLLNKSVNYFKDHDRFEKTDFTESVFVQPEMVASFNAYNAQNKDRGAVEVVDNFPISNLAVKQNSKIFKSVLKLDKNFHVYIHGDRKFIERGKDEDGKKYYKLYYERED